MPKYCNVCGQSACSFYHGRWWCIAHALTEMERVQKLGEWARLVRLVEEANGHSSTVPLPRS